MKIGTLVRVRPAFVNLMNVPNGRIALEVCKIEREIAPHVEDAQKVLGNYVKQHAPKGKSSIDPKDPGFEEATKYMNDLYDQDVKVTWKPIVLDEDFVNNSTLSGANLMSLMEAEVVTLETPKKPAPRKSTPRKPAAKSGTRKK